jgi:hypothetical protein
MLTLQIEVDAIKQSLREAATQLQSYYLEENGTHYRVEDLQRCLESWLELSIESLVEDVLFHTTEGDRSYAFNRSAFDQQLQKIQPLRELDGEDKLRAVVREAAA